MKILIVDDEQLVRWFLDRALKKGGHEVSSVSNINDGAARLSAEHFDLLFVDLRMPEGSGTELIKKLEGLPYRPKVIVCSAYITSELEEEFRTNDICILKKPFKLDELNSVLGACISA
ncbi:MAG: response regulator [Nitrospirae bacterium]|nr:MAG: response regulator [Nitrospirota bacterium]